MQSLIDIDIDKCLRRPQQKKITWYNTLTHLPQSKEQGRRLWSPPTPAMQRKTAIAASSKVGSGINQNKARSFPFFPIQPKCTPKPHRLIHLHIRCAQTPRPSLSPYDRLFRRNGVIDRVRRRSGALPSPPLPLLMHLPRRLPLPLPQPSPPSRLLDCSPDRSLRKARCRGARPRLRRPAQMTSGTWIDPELPALSRTETGKPSRRCGKVK